MASQGTPPVETNKKRSGGGTSSGPRKNIPRNDASKCKVGPNKVGDLQYTEEASLKGRSFVLILGAGHLDQFTFHRPIGVTPLADDSWVCTPTSEVQELLLRVSSEARKRAESQRALHVRNSVLAANIGRRTMNEQEVFATSGSNVQSLQRTLMVRAKAELSGEHRWTELLTGTDLSDQLLFAAALKDEGRKQAAEAAIPLPPHETCGGPLGERPQQAIAYLQGKTLLQARQEILMRMFGRGTAVAVPQNKSSAQAGGS